jgi:hypothetical protein
VGTWLTKDTIKSLVPAVHPRAPALAARVAAAGKKTLADFGLASPPSAAQGTVEPAPYALDAVLCAAAEAGDVTPRQMRAGLLAALKRARECGLPLERMEALLERRAR